MANAPQALKPTALPYALESDFFDPTEDGSDVMWVATNVQGLASTSLNGFSNVTIDAAIDFYWMMTTLQADVAGGAQVESGIVIPIITVRVKDAGSGKNLENIKFPVGAMAGFGERCYRLNAPRRIAGNTQLAFGWTTNVAAGTTYTNLFLVLHGYTKPAGS